MIWICDENRVGSTGIFELLLSSAYTASKSVLLLTLLCQRVDWRCARSWEGTQLGQLTPADQRGVPYHVMLCTAIKAVGRRKGDVGRGGVCLLE